MAVGTQREDVISPGVPSLSLAWAVLNSALPSCEAHVCSLSHPAPKRERANINLRKDQSGCHADRQMGGRVRGPAIEINKRKMNVQDELEHAVTPESKGVARVDKQSGSREPKKRTFKHQLG